MTQLNQIIAVEKGLKSRTTDAVTKVYHDLQKPALFAGLSRKYTPVNEEGEQLPPESTLVQQYVENELRRAGTHLAKLFDVVATKEKGNRHASADVVVDGETLVADAPVPLLLFLEKQLANLRTVVSKVPILDPSESWSPNEGSYGFRTEPVLSIRTRKVPKTLVKAPATDKHPAQVEVYMQDEPAGRWATTRFSGAVHTVRRDDLVARIDALADALKKAREKANGTEVVQENIGASIFEYLLASS